MKRLPTLVVLSATLALTACSGNDDNGEDRMKRPAPATAQEGLADMKALFRDLAALVGTISDESYADDYGARFCDPPLDDLVFFDWGLDIDVTSAPTGAAALDAIEHELDTRGLTFRRSTDDQGENVRANDGRMVMRVRGSKTSRGLGITGSSACGPGEEYEEPAVP